MPRAPHPSKEKVIQWLAKQHDKRPYPGSHSAMDAAREHFSGEDLPATLRQWAAEAIDYKPRTRRSKRGKDPRESFTFETALQQIEAIKARMIDGLRNQQRQILLQQQEIEGEKKKLDAAIEQCSRITGAAEKDIRAQLGMVQI